MTVTRKNLQGKLLAGQIKGRPGMYATPRPEGMDPGVMATPEAVERVRVLMRAHPQWSFGECFRRVLLELAPPPGADV
jgi:hypothetical protein